MSHYYITQKILRACVLIVLAACLSGTVVSVASGQTSTSEFIDSDAILKNTLVEALKATEQVRQKDKSTMVDCTRSFEKFRQYQKTTPYISFFKSINIPIIIDYRNNRHYVAFQLNYGQLKSLGFERFLTHDRVVIVFTTLSATSDEITSFEVTLLNTNHL